MNGNDGLFPSFMSFLAAASLLEGFGRFLGPSVSTDFTQHIASSHHMITRLGSGPRRCTYYPAIITAHLYLLNEFIQWKFT